MAAPEPRYESTFFATVRDDAISSALTNADGRCETPLLQDELFVAGQYELVFHAGEYFNARGTGRW